jgi:adenosylhomocysteine nucleosidase
LTKIGIVTALRSEAACLTSNKLNPSEPHHLNDQILLLLSGMGSSRVNDAITSLLAHGVEALVSFGTAGALSGGVKSGDIIVPDKIIDTNGNTQALSSPWRDKALQQLNACPATVHNGDMVSTDNVITSAADKHALHEKTAAIAVDMESALITTAAHSHGLPSLVIRVIVDEANMTIPGRILANTNAYGQVAILALLCSILLQPMLIRELLRLGAAFKTAEHSMRWIGNHAEQVFLLPN